MVEYEKFPEIDKKVFKRFKELLDKPRTITINGNAEVKIANYEEFIGSLEKTEIPCWTCGCALYRLKGELICLAVELMEESKKKVIAPIKGQKYL